MVLEDSVRALATYPKVKKVVQKDKTVFVRTVALDGWGIGEKFFSPFQMRFDFTCPSVDEHSNRGISFIAEKPILFTEPDSDTVGLLSCPHVSCTVSRSSGRKTYFFCYHTPAWRYTLNTALQTHDCELAFNTILHFIRMDINSKTFQSAARTYLEKFGSPSREVVGKFLWLPTTD